MRDTLLGVRLSKQFGSQCRPHIVGPALRAKRFAPRAIFTGIKKNDKIFAKLLMYPTADEFFKMAANITQHTLG